jgi:hypothetical protein
MRLIVLFIPPHGKTRKHKLAIRCLGREVGKEASAICTRYSMRIVWVGTLPDKGAWCMTLQLAVGGEGQIAFSYVHSL